MLKKAGFVILTILIFLLGAEMMVYFLCPIYDFPVPKPFSGTSIYNPYKGMNPKNWKKANFHYHSRAWGGLTSGRRNSYELFDENYRRKLKYDFPEISDYMKINDHFRDSSFYIPCYEHGLGVRKKHHMLIGARKVLWFDYSLFQNIHQKQDMLNRLQGTSGIVAIAHPDWENGFTTSDMNLLSGYDLLEILDHNWRSFFQWDAALSSGHPVYILADDDSHDVSDPYEIGRCATFINSSSSSGDSIVKELRDGKAFGADLNMSDSFTDFEKKAEDAKLISLPQSVEVRGDTLFVGMDRSVRKITFIGQNQVYKKVTRGERGAFYVFKPEDTYIRTEIQCYSKDGQAGSVIYLNPVFRYDGNKPVNVLRAEVNWPRTWIYRLFSIPALLALYYFFIRYLLKKIKKTVHA